MPDGLNVSALRARPTSYRGTLMRSRLEARFAQFLDACGVTWEYEPMCFAGPTGQYLPDFRTDHLGERMYWEVKPPREAGWCPGVVADKMAIIWASEPDAVLALAVPGWPLTEVVQYPGRRGADLRAFDEDVVWPERWGL